ncbi:hypothetical protein IFR04_006219 [Cadophora malorum]|uniref:Uncharacterized protein n=1 Tax=Cadophora malorum TaxID=108018 RepID=A0A8H7WBE2_9HELO|nr:hypothetical protein IFR04_006219 [Cadophora malorum]
MLQRLQPGNMGSSSTSIQASNPQTAKSALEKLFNGDSRFEDYVKQKFDGQIWDFGLFKIVSLLREQ